MAEVIVQAQSTISSRQGHTLNQRGYTLAGGLPDLIASAYTFSKLTDTVNSAEKDMLYNILLQDREIIPGGLTLYNIQALDPDVFTGAAELLFLMILNPFGSEYETATQALYDRQYATARAAAQSGPVNVRGGTVRQGIELAELDTQQSINRFREVWQNQVAVAQLVESATQLYNTISNQIRSLQLQAQTAQAGTEQGRAQQQLIAAEQLNRDRDSHIRALAAGGEFLGVPFMLNQETYYGEGMQATINTGFGMSYWK